MQHVGVRRVAPAQGSVGTERNSGQALVEFALLAPLLFVILFGIIQFGFLFSGQVGLTNTAREVARYTSTALTNSTAAATAQLNAALPRNVPGYNGSAISTISYCWYTNPGTPTTYSTRVRVAVSYAHPLFIPIVGVLVDGADGAEDQRLRIGVVEEMRVETPAVKTQPGGSACP